MFSVIAKANRNYNNYMETKTTFNFSNWFKNNSPKFIQIIGDIGLLAAFITTNFLVFKQNLIDLGLTQIANSPMFDKVNTICLAIGVFIKLISKFFGINYQKVYGDQLQQDTLTDEKK
jgi:hypothetical protein